MWLTGRVCAAEAAGPSDVEGQSSMEMETDTSITGRPSITSREREVAQGTGRSGQGARVKRRTPKGSAM